MQIVNIVLPVFLIIALGYGLRITRFLSEDVNAALIKLVFYVSAPVLLFHSSLKTPVADSLDLPALGIMGGVTFALAIIVYLAAFRADPRRRGVLAQGVQRSNMVFMGLPVVAYAYGDSVLGPASVVVGFMVIIYNFVAVLVLSLPRRRTSAKDAAVWTDTVVQMVRNPLIIGCACGIIGSLLGWRPPLALDRSIELVGRVALPLALISVGAGLDLGKLKADIPAATWVSLMKLIVYPALVWLGLRMTGRTDVTAQILVMLAATPTAVVSYVMAGEMNGDHKLAGAIVIGSTLASLLTLLGWLIFLRAVS